MPRFFLEIETNSYSPKQFRDALLGAADFGLELDLEKPPRVQASTTLTRMDGDLEFDLDGELWETADPNGRITMFILDKQPLGTIWIDAEPPALGHLVRLSRLDGGGEGVAVVKAILHEESNLAYVWLERVDTAAKPTPITSTDPELPIRVDRVCVLQLAVQLPGDDPDDPWDAPEGQGFVVMQMPLDDVRRMPLNNTVEMTLAARAEPNE